MLTSIRRRVSVLACAIATAALGVEFSLLGQSASAQIEADTLVCTGTQATTFNPGLRLIPQPTTITAVGSLAPCASIGEDRGITSGDYNSTNQGLASCLLNSISPFSITYNWNDGKYSTVRFDTIVNVRAVAQTTSTATGIVTDGEYEGARAVRQILLPSQGAIGCVTPEGATSNSGSVTLTLIKSRIALP